MEGRSGKLRIDNEEEKEQEVEMGVPQASLVSPVLFNVYIAPFLRHLKENGKEIGCEMNTPTFVDDVTRAIAGADKVEAMEMAERIVKESEEWGSKNGIKFESKKTEWIELSGENGEKEGETWSIEVGGGWKEKGRCVKWLGIWIDKKLNFKEHEDKKFTAAMKVTSAIWGL